MDNVYRAGMNREEFEKQKNELLAKLRTEWSHRVKEYETLGHTEFENKYGKSGTWVEGELLGYQYTVQGEMVLRKNIGEYPDFFPFHEFRWMEPEYWKAQEAVDSMVSTMDTDKDEMATYLYDAIDNSEIDYLKRQEWTLGYWMDTMQKTMEEMAELRQALRDKLIARDGTPIEKGYHYVKSTFDDSHNFYLTVNKNHKPSREDFMKHVEQIWQGIQGWYEQK